MFVALFFVSLRKYKYISTRVTNENQNLHHKCVLTAVTYGFLFTQVLKDTKDVQKEINTLSGKLDRTFAVTDELIFRVFWIATWFSKQKESDLNFCINLDHLAQEDVFNNNFPWMIGSTCTSKLHMFTYKCLRTRTEVMLMSDLAVLYVNVQYADHESDGILFHCILLCTDINVLLINLESCKGCCSIVLMSMRSKV